MDGNGVGWVGFVNSFAPGVVVNKDRLRTRLQVYKAEILAQFPHPPHPPPPFSSQSVVPVKQLLSKLVVNKLGQKFVSEKSFCKVVW
jgi:hypothetical protein